MTRYKEPTVKSEIARLLTMNIQTVFSMRCGRNGILVVYDTCEKPAGEDDLRIAFLGFVGLDAVRTILLDIPVEPPEEKLSLRERIYQVLDPVDIVTGMARERSTDELTDAVFRAVLPDTIHKNTAVRTFGAEGPSSFRDDAASYLSQHGQHGIVQDIVEEWVIDGPGNCIFQYETLADVRIACVGRNAATGKLEIKWDNPA